MVHSPFPYRVYRSRLGVSWAMTSEGEFSAQMVREYLAAEGFLSAALNHEVTAHHRTKAYQTLFLAQDMPVAVDSFAAWFAHCFKQKQSTNTLIVTPTMMIGYMEVSNHSEAEPRVRLFEHLAAHGPVLCRNHPDAPWDVRQSASLFTERTITASTPTPNTFLDFAFWPRNGTFDAARIKRHLAGYWGWSPRGDWHFLCSSACDLRSVAESDLTHGIGYTGSPAIRISPYQVSVYPRSGDHALLRHVVEWLTTTWECRGQETDYGTEWPLGVTVHHVCPPNPMNAVWRHGFDGVANAALWANCALLSALHSEDLETARRAAFEVLARDDSLLPWLLYGSALGSEVCVGPRLANAPYAETVVTELVLGSSCPLYNRFELDLSYVELLALPEGLRRITSLKQLRANGCELTVLPDWLGEFEHLEYLSLSSNALTSLPKSLTALVGLQELALSDNPFMPESWPAARAVLRQMTSLNRLWCNTIEAWSLEQVAADLPGVEVG